MVRAALALQVKLVLLGLLVALLSCTGEASANDTVNKDLLEFQEVLPVGAKALEVLSDGRGNNTWLLWRFSSKCYLSPVYYPGPKVYGMAESICPFSF